MNDNATTQLFEVKNTAEERAQNEVNEPSQETPKPKKNIAGFIIAMSILLGVPAAIVFYKYEQNDPSIDAPSSRYVTSPIVRTAEPVLLRPEILLQTTPLDSLQTATDRETLSRYPLTRKEKRLAKLKSETVLAVDEIRLERAKLLELFGSLQSILRKLESSNSQSASNTDAISASVAKLGKHVDLLAKTSKKIEIASKSPLTAFGAGVIAVAPSVPSLDEYVVKGFINGQASVALRSRPNTAFILRKGSAVEGHGRVLAFKWENGLLLIELENGTIGGSR